MAMLRSFEKILGRALAVVPVTVSGIFRPSGQTNPTDGAAIAVSLVDVDGVPYTAGGGGGGGAVTIADGADVTQGAIANTAYDGVTATTSQGYLRAIADAAVDPNPADTNLAQVDGTMVTVGAGNVTANTPRFVIATDQAAFGVTVAGVSTAANQASVIGTKAAGTAATNSILTGGVFNTTLPTLTDGQQAATQLTSRGVLLTTVASSAGTTASVTTAADGSSLGSGLITVSAMSLYNGTNFDRGRTIVGALAAGTGTMAMVRAPTSAAAAAVTPVKNSAAGSDVVVKGSAGNLHGFNVAAGASAGYALLFDATTAPADGAVTPVKAYAIAANATIDVKFDPPIRLATGIVVSFSTTGPFTKTASATAFISGDAV